MRSGVPARWSFVVLGVAGITLAAATIFYLAPVDEPTPGKTARLSTKEPPIAAALPIRIKIPKINIDAPLEYVGLTPEGTMAIPKGPTNAAWFDLGPVPGQNGSAVIAGHEGWKDGIAAIFDDLNKLEPGDRVYVKNSTGTDAVFVVRKAQTYDENANAAAIFGSNDEKAHLNLITCEGIWNSARKSYSERLVVFTDEL